MILIDRIVTLRSRSPCGERGLKCKIDYIIHTLKSRSPCGERGLKFCFHDFTHRPVRSLPVRGAWIEISSMLRIAFMMVVAPRAGSVD